MLTHPTNFVKIVSSPCVQYKFIMSQIQDGLEVGLEVKEGFLCPICIKDFKVASKLQLHFNQMHASDTYNDRNHHIRHDKSKLEKSDISSPQSSTFQHKFGISNDLSKNIFDDPHLTKQLLELAGLEEEVLKKPGQKEEIENFCVENDVGSLLKRYVVLSENPEWKMSIPTTRWYVDIETDSTYPKHTNKNIRVDSFDFDDRNSYRVSQSIYENDKPPLPPKPVLRTVQRRNYRKTTRKLKSSTPSTSTNLLKRKGKPPPLPKSSDTLGSTYGTALRPPAPPLPDFTSTKLDLGVTPKNLKNRITKSKRTSGIGYRETNASNEKKNSGPTNIRCALQEALDKISKDVRSSESSFNDSDSSSNEEWME